MNKNRLIPLMDQRFMDGICHRGLHGNGVPENSKKAFQLAMEANMAFEFDVHLTKDKKLVVFHDFTTDRVCGKPGTIEELTLKEIKENYPLPDGSQIMTLEELLEMNNWQVPIVCEIKANFGHSHPVARKARKVLDQYCKDKSKIYVISFNGFSLLHFKGYMRQFLVSYNRTDLFAFRGFFEGVDLDFRLLRRKPYQKYSFKHLTNVYTIQTEEEYLEASKYADTVTFQFVSKDFIREHQRKKLNR